MSADIVPKHLDEGDGDGDGEGDYQGEAINPAWVLDPEHPEHRCRQLTEEADIRRCLKKEGESENPRQSVIATLNQRLQTVREIPERTDSHWGAISVDEARSIATMFGADEVCKQLRHERNRDEPREAVITALEERLEEVAKP